MGVFLNVLMILVFLLMGAGSVYLTNHVLRQHTLEMAEDKTQLILDRNLATHTYFSHDLKPAVFSLTESTRDEEYFDPTWMSSTYAIRKIEEYFLELTPTDYYYKEAAINARSPQNEADEFEKNFLEAVNEDEELIIRSKVRKIEGEKYFTTLRRGEVMQESCLRCHSDPETAPSGLVNAYGDEHGFQRQVGKIVSAISIRIPLKETYREMRKLTWMISGFMSLSLVGLFLVLNWVRSKFVMEPLERIGKKAVLISKSSEHLGEQIKPPLFKEMARVSSSFNTMSAALRRERDILEERVEERTAELEEAKERIEHMAQHDSLTGLPNRRLFKEHFEQTLKLAHRNRVPVTLMVADLDNFKEINDTYGHTAGDAVLRAVGRRMAETLRESDMVARWGGDEFTILLYDAGDKKSLQIVAKKIFSTLEKPIDVGQESFVINVSIGVAKYPHEGENIDTLLKHADLAMYEAKETAGNSCSCFNADHQ